MSVNIWEGNKAQELINAVNNSAKIDKQQGSLNAGKALIVGADGLVGLGNTGLSDEAKIALLECFKNVAWVSEDGQTYYSELARTLYGEPKTDQAILSWNYKMGGTPFDAGFKYRDPTAVITETKPSELVEEMTSDGLKMTHDGSANNNVGYLVPTEIAAMPNYNLEIECIIKSLSTAGAWFGFGMYLRTLIGFVVFNNNGVCIGGSTVSSFKPSLNVPHIIKVMGGWLYCDNTAIVKVDSDVTTGLTGIITTKGSEQIIRRVEFIREG